MVVVMVILQLLSFYQVDVCIQAYNQEDLEDENECEVSCRDVGHNIFILAHQVLLFNNRNCIKQY